MSQACDRWINAVFDVFFHPILDEHVWEFEEAFGIEDWCGKERGTEKYGNEKGR